MLLRTVVMPPATLGVLVSLSRLARATAVAGELYWYARSGKHDGQGALQLDVRGASTGGENPNRAEREAYSRPIGTGADEVDSENAVW
jgi:hypothetical protein